MGVTTEQHERVLVVRIEREEKRNAVDQEIADALVRHRFALDDAPEAFRVAGDRAAGAIKVLLGP